MQPCYFCGRSVPEIDKMTKEHLFGEWSEEALPEQAPGHSFTKLVLNPLTGNRMDETYSAPVPLFQSSVHGYCNECNSGWMNGLDEAVRVHGSELFYGRALNLSMDLMTSIATWATKLAIVKDTQDYKNSGAVSQERRSWLYEQRTPPPRTWVWAACLSDDPRTQAIRHHTRLIEDDWNAPLQFGPGKVLPRANTSFTTFSYHRLAVVVASTDNASLGFYDPAELFSEVIVRLLGLIRFDGQVASLDYAA